MYGKIPLIIDEGVMLSILFFVKDDNDVHTQKIRGKVSSCECPLCP